MINVSVIVPVYNMEKYLGRCLDSLLNQTLEGIEIVAVDDGSTDSSPEILKSYADLHTKIICVRKENGGLSDARNYGFQFASGEYVGYLDSDDFADPEMFEIMYCKARESDADIVECNLHHTFAGYEDTETMVKYYDPKELLCYGRHIVWNKIYRRSWLVATNVRFPFGLIYEDVSFFARLVPYITGYAYVDIAPVHYVQRKESLNNASSIKTMQIFKILKGILDFYEQKGFYSRFETELEYMYARILLCSSFVRMCRIPDRSQRKKALKSNYRELNDAFPHWRKNTVLAGDKGRHARFMKAQNAFVYRFFCAAAPLFLRLKAYFGPEMGSSS